MKLIILALASAALTGCAMRLIPAKVDGNEAFVSVWNVWGPNDGLPYAATHCAKFDRLARFNRQEGYAAVFDCVPRS